MYACKLEYDYKQLCLNYLEANLQNGMHIVPRFTSTTQERLSFSGDLLYSYNTPVAKFIKGTTGNYLLSIDVNVVYTTADIKDKVLEKFLNPDLADLEDNDTVKPLTGSENG